MAKSRPRPSAATSGPKGENVAGHGHGQAGHAPKKGGIKTMNKSAKRSNKG
jgi:hypothetical protein